MSPFTLIWQPKDRILVMTLGGFWGDDDMSAFSTELTELVNRTKRMPFDVIAIVEELVAQSQQVVLLQSDLMADVARAGMARLAIVGAGPLLTMQIKRAAAPLVPHFTTSEALARTWLRTG